MKTVAFVPAKGHSERIKNKNLAIIDGEHLFRRKLLQLLECSEIDEVYLDTESDEIAALATDLPIKRLVRPKEFATNATDGHELFAYECSQVRADLYIQCLCTAPFVDSAAIGRALRALRQDPEADSLVAVQSLKHYTWQDRQPAYGNQRIPNSVDLPSTVVEAMSLYMVKKPGAGTPQRRFGKKPVLFELTPREALDINQPDDLDLAERICAGDRAEINQRLRSLKGHLTSSILADIAKEAGISVVLPPGIRPVSEGRFLGRAKTLELGTVTNGDSWKGIYNALESYSFIRCGDVIVVSTTVPHRAYFGDLNANLALRAGAIGAVIDGFTRDTPWVRKLDFPVYAHGSYCQDIKYEGTVRAMNKPIRIGGVEIRNGDYIFADPDGVVAIPQHSWPGLIDLAWQAMDKEWRIRLAVARGEEVNQVMACYGPF